MCAVLGESENGNTIYHTIDLKRVVKRKQKERKTKLLLTSKIVVVQRCRTRQRTYTHKTKENKYKMPSGLSFLVAIASGTIYPSRQATTDRNRFSLFSGAHQTTLVSSTFYFGSFLVTFCVPVNHHMLCLFFSLFTS